MANASIIVKNIVVNAKVDNKKTIVSCSIGEKLSINSSLSYPRYRPMLPLTIGDGVPVYTESTSVNHYFRSFVSDDNSINITVTDDGEINLSSAESIAISIQIFELKRMLKGGIDTYYTEFINDVDDNPTNIDKWTNSSKTTKLFSKVITWTDGNATSISTTDETTGAVLTSTFTYDLNGNVTSITEILS